MHERFMAVDVVEDFDAGFEYAEAEAVVRIVQRGDQRQCLVRCNATSLTTRMQACARPCAHHCSATQRTADSAHWRVCCPARI